MRTPDAPFPSWEQVLDDYRSYEAEVSRLVRNPLRFWTGDLVTVAACCVYLSFMAVAMLVVSPAVVRGAGAVRGGLGVVIALAIVLFVVRQARNVRDGRRNAARSTASADHWSLPLHEPLSHGFARRYHDPAGAPAVFEVEEQQVTLARICGRTASVVLPACVDGHRADVRIDWVAGEPIASYRPWARLMSTEQTGDRS